VHRQPKTKTRRARTVALPAAAVKAIRDRLAAIAELERESKRPARTPETLLFGTRNGTPWQDSNLRRSFGYATNLLDDLGVAVIEFSKLEFTPHMARRSAATAVYHHETGGRAPTRAMLGHQDDTELPAYVHDLGLKAPDFTAIAASTSKALSAAALLDSVGIAGLRADVDIAADDIVSYSPQTQQHVGASMTLGELAAASVQHSDNTAANLVVEHLGGPAGFDAALSRIGDATTETTRTEPSLNEAVPGDRRDTTTPRAITADLRTYVLGDVLSGEERELLRMWLIDHSLGDTLIRAGTPKGWTVGDKSGAAAYGTRNDIAVIWPPSGSPIVIAVMSSRTEADAEYDDALVAAAAQAAVASLKKRS